MLPSCLPPSVDVLLLGLMSLLEVEPSQHLELRGQKEDVSLLTFKGRERRATYKREVRRVPQATLTDLTAYINYEENIFSCEAITSVWMKIRIINSLHNQRYLWLHHRDQHTITVVERNFGCLLKILNRREI